MGIRRLLRRRRQRRLKRHARVRVLMVCRVNHCRSPMAEGLFGWKLAAAGLADQVYVDSAGVSAQMIGQPPDPRGQRAAAEYGVDISSIRSRQIVAADFAEFEYVVAMDRRVYQSLLELCTTPEQQRRVHLLRSFAPHAAAAAVADDDDGDSVPDPYYGGPSGFERVIDLLDRCADGLLQHLRRQYSL